MLSNDVDSYLAVRRTSGYQMGAPELILRSYARFAEKRTEAHVKTRTVIDWATQAPSQNQRIRCLTTVIRFARYLHAEDQRHQVPPRDLLGHRCGRFLPYIFTVDEIDRLLQAASRLKPTDCLRPNTYTTLFALLVTTGLRISEALALLIDDLTPDGLHIRETKFKKSRIVPIHESTELGLGRYLEMRNRVVTSDRHIFISANKRLGYDSVLWAFLKVLAEIGLNPPPCGRRPRIHDLRHTFACRALESCPPGRGNVDRHIRALSIYMGHVEVANTFWYLESTPRIMEGIAHACESFSTGGNS